MLNANVTTMSAITTKWFTGVALASALSLVPDLAAAAVPAVFVPLDANQGQLPESITTDDDGNIYLSLSNTIGKISPSGQLTTFATIPIPAGAVLSGLKFDDDGFLYAGSAGFTPEPAAAFIWRISPNGHHVEEYAELDPNGFPNDLAFDDDGNLYVTDPFLGQIWKIDECGNPEVWLKDPLLDPNVEDPYLVIAPFGVDGIAFDKQQKNLYVGNLDYGRILKIKLDKHGEPDDIDVFYENIGLIGGVDGIAFDKKENLFLAVHGQDRIVSLDKHAHATIVAQNGPLQQPSSLVFGATKASKKTLYIANFAILAYYGIKPGPPRPALLKLAVQNGGQDLP